MGIKNLSKLLTDNANSAYKLTRLDTLSGTRVAIDGHNLMYTNLAVARKKIINKTDVALEEPDEAEIQKEWIRMILEHMLTWLSYNITPVFVLDGQHILEKTETKEERKQKKDELFNKIDGIRDKLKGKDPLVYPINVVADLRKYLCQINTLSADNVNMLKLVLTNIGLPVVQAKHDGEQLCSMLCIEGKVSAVFSTDTDNVAYGCPLTLNKFADYIYTDRGRVHQCESVDYAQVIKGLNVSRDEFVDICIMSGCDFNSTINGVASKTAYKLIKAHSTIDKLPDKYNVECLNHVKCRSLFKTIKSSELIISGQLDINVETFTKNGRETLEYAKNAHFMSRFDAFYKNMTVAKDVDRTKKRPLVNIVTENREITEKKEHGTKTPETVDKRTIIVDQKDIDKTQPSGARQVKKPIVRIV